MKFEKPDKKNIIKNILRNIRDSNRGLAIMFKESSTVRRLIPLELAAGVILGIISDFAPLEYVIMVFVLVVLFTTETANSAVEEVNDRVTDEIDEKVKRSKDMASASVWIWHLVYIFCVLFFIVCHLAHFAWWQHLIPS